MNKRKLIRSHLLVFVIGLIIGSIGIVIAESINSDEILYDNANSGSSATNVEDALDSLFNAIHHSGAGYSIITHNSADVSTELLGGLYRYQGNNPDNYICFGTTSKSTCTGDTNKYMYRIIGFKENGQLKLIKYTSIGNYAYHSVNENATWPNSDLFKKLNGMDASDNIFLNTDFVPMGWEERIATENWKYGDTANINAATMYEVENDFTSFVSAKIGIMYIHDLNFANCGLNECTNRERYNSWIYSYKEHFITRYGYGASSYGYMYLVYFADNSGSISKYISDNYIGGYITTPGTVHPVFYLNLNQIIVSGSGTISDPYILS
jgi:hypothetical protein